MKDSEKIRNDSKKVIRIFFTIVRIMTELGTPVSVGIGIGCLMKLERSKFKRLCMLVGGAVTGAALTRMLVMYLKKCEFDSLQNVDDIVNAFEGMFAKEGEA